jgi:hypothetical protein
MHQPTDYRVSSHADQHGHGKRENDADNYLAPADVQVAKIVHWKFYSRLVERSSSGSAAGSRNARKAPREGMKANHAARWLSGQLVGEDAYFVDRGRFRQKLVRLRHERSSHLTVEMSVAAGLIIERIEDCERRRPFLDSEPSHGTRFVLNKRKRRFKEVCDLLFLSGFCFERNVQREF